MSAQRRGSAAWERVAQAFRARFANWGLEIPAANLKARRPGFIQSQGWLIQYTFGRNARGEYMDYYASNRWTDDTHVRLYASGREQHLAALGGSEVCALDELEAARARALRRDRQVARMLIKKGFDKFTLPMMILISPP